MAMVDSIPSIRDPEVQQNPYPVLDMIREATPVYRHPEFMNIAMVTRYDDCVRVLRDSETFSNDAYRELRSGGIGGSPRVREILATGFPPALALAQTDGAVHDFHASMIQPFLSGRRLRSLVDTVQQLVDEIVADLPVGEPFNSVARFSEPLSMAVMSEFVGVPVEDRDIFIKGSDGEALLLGSHDEELLLEAAQDYVNLQLYAAEQIEDRRRNPREDLITSVATTPAPDGVGEPEMAQLVHVLKSVFTAGNETTRAALSASLLRFAREPQWAEAVRGDESVLNNFVEEILRTDTPLLMLFRKATSDVDISGEVIKEGEILAVVYAAANRDPRQFEDPLTFKLGRPSPRRHLTFSLGAHFCLGAPLARLELKLGIKAMLDKFDRFELVEGEAPKYAPSFFVHNLKNLELVGHAAR